MKKIIFMSRLDFDCSRGAYLLCNIARELSKKYEDMEIVIIGGGTEYSEISRKAEQINRSCSRGLIFAVGSIEEPLIHYDCDSLFIGVSRSALEAMARGAPVILLGNEGYLGLLSGNNAEQAIKTNLTCRGFGSKANARILLRDICRFYDLPRAERKKLSALSSKIAKDVFSREQMSTKTLQFYKSVLQARSPKEAERKKKREKICLCGYYGRGNFGDEAILAQILNKIRKSRHENAQICVINGKNPLKAIAASSGADLFIFGGGSLLQSSTSRASLFCYLCVIFIAELLAKDKIMLANGIGPFKENRAADSFLKRLTQKAINAFDLISTRDTDSQKLLRAWLPKRKIRLVHDPAWTYFDIEDKQSKKSISPGAKKKGCLVFIPNERALMNEKISATEASHALSRLCRALSIDLKIVTLCQEDERLAKRITAGARGASIHNPKSPAALIKLLSEAEICLSQRYHGALFASAIGIPTVALSSDPKLNTLCKEIKFATSLETSALLREREAAQACARATAGKNAEKARRDAKAYAKKADKALVQIFEYL